MLYFQQLLAIGAQRPDFSVLMGPEELLAEAVLLGGSGGVCGGANLDPRLYVELFDAAVTGDLQRVLQLQQQVLRLATRLYTVGDPPSAYLTGLKAALAALGIGTGLPAPPLTPLSGDRRQRIEQHVRDLGLLSAANAAARG
jgi:4-hydroxy-tetrahydrodipicolinate synthase